MERDIELFYDTAIKYKDFLCWLVIHECRIMFYGESLAGVVYTWVLDEDSQFVLKAITTVLLVCFPLIVQPKQGMCRVKRT